MSKRARRLNGILFDWDGVLHDSLGANFRVYNKILGELGMRRLTEKEFVALQSANWYAFYMRIGIEKRLWREADDMWRRFYSSQKTGLYHDTKRCLSRLREEGYRIALVTNGSRERVARELALFGVTRFFDVVICSQNAGELKPSPVMLVRALERLDLKRSEAAYVGDSDVDIVAARRAHVASRYSKEQKASQPLDCCRTRLHVRQFR